MRKALFLLVGLVAVIFLGSGTARAINDIPPGGTNWIQGLDPNPTTSGFQNAGVLRLESVDDSFNVTLYVTNGLITNLPSGSIQINGGAGGTRTLTASVINQGKFVMTTSAELGIDFGKFDQSGSFSVAFQALAEFFGTAEIFNQMDGVITLDGAMQLWNGSFNFSGGKITGLSGVIYLINEALSISSAATSSANFQMNGSNCRFSGNIAFGQTLMVLGGYIYSDATVTAPGTLNNAGLIRMIAANPGSCSLALSSGVLTNAASGRLTSEVGGGGPRSIRGDVVNLGTLDIFQPLAITLNRSPMQDDGVINLPAGARLSIQGDYTRLSNSICRIVLGPASASPSSIITVSGDATLDGDLQVSFSSGVSPRGDDEYILIQSRSRSGVFATTTLPPLTGALKWNLDYGLNTVRLTVVDPNKPKGDTAKITIQSENLVRYTYSSAATTNGGYVLQASTNLFDWTSLLTNSPFSGSIQYDSSIEPYGKRFFRLLSIE